MSFRCENFQDPSRNANTPTLTIDAQCMNVHPPQRLACTVAQHSSIDQQLYYVVPISLVLWHQQSHMPCADLHSLTRMPAAFDRTTFQRSYTMGEDRKAEMKIGIRV
ncbi:UNVERIFIED_CONTAM: hypothetical protein Sindi_1710300 [Sesamum indicum]